MQNPGEILKEERIKKGLSIKEASEEIKISPAFLEAIEKNNLNYLPGGFFKRNFVRAYARFLGLDEEYILQVFNLIKKEPPKTDQIKKKKLIKVEQLSIILSFFFGILILFFVILLAYKSGQKKDTNPETSIANLVISEAKSEQTFPEKEPDKIEIILKAIEDTWIDANLDGRRILYKIIKKGEEIRLEGREFLFNAIGKPEGIFVLINGYESIPMGEPGKVVKNIRIDIKNFRDFIKK